MFIYSDNTGKVIRIISNEGEFRNYGEPNSFTYVLNIDFSVNQQIRKDLDDNIDSFIIVSNNILKYNNTVVTIIEDSSEMKYIRDINSFIDDTENRRSIGIRRLEEMVALLLIMHKKDV